MSAKKPAAKATAPRRAAPPATLPAGPPRTEVPAGLGRSRRTLPDDERLEIEDAPAEVPNLIDNRIISSARAGHDELRERLREHTETGPRLTGGDIDADWEDAYSVGDEAPGGDNPTPDQDRVDDIGRALGVTYQDSQELEGGEEISERDRHRWEYDPASSDDWPHDKKARAPRTPVEDTDQQDGDQDED
ncbi:MAG: DUF6335 family protein [Vicinamibacterales bacterium]